MHLFESVRPLFEKISENAQGHLQIFYEMIMVARLRDQSSFELEVIIRRGEREPDRRPPPPRDIYDREDIIIRRDQDDRRTLPPRDDFERDEVIIRRDRDDRRPPPRREEIDREELIIRDDRTARGGRYRDEIDRDEVIFRDNGRRGGAEIDFERDDVISRRDPDRYDRVPAPREIDREEIIINRNRDRDDSRYERPLRDDDFGRSRHVSHERARSRSRPRESDEIIIRRDREDSRGPRRGAEREEIVIRRDRSSSNESRPISQAPSVPENDRMIRAPDIHQNVITHHRHVYHDDMVIERSRPRTPLPPSPPPPPPPPPPAREDETIEIRRRGERNGRAYDEDIIINRESTPAPPPLRRPPPPPPSEYAPLEPYRPPPPVFEPPPRRIMDPRDERDIREEAEFYNQKALERSYPGEAYHGSTTDWAIVDVPPGTHRVRMDGAGGGAQEITWQRYNGVRRSRFMPDGSSSDEGYGSEVGRPAMGGEGRRYVGMKNARDGLWTEITKDLVVREALEQCNFEFEETDDFYYVIAYLKYEDVARLVGLSEDIRHDRRRRIKEIDWERRALPPPMEERRETLLIEDVPRRAEPRPWDREDELYREREIVVRGGGGGRPYR
ncbi:hypothetical protein UCRPC4_g03176 [Phaeomoniella chlamydospora]|uniref:DUF8035 domain-containing protein n=1 Tax=Phaeomoniella chlamydospora TaxID=158046 RepID=A0A0G2EJX9_PHACM|nr:hypothetical protein UCRPC4_g03176 [Phaeomoniella chlamydospora]